MFTRKKRNKTKVSRGIAFLFLASVIAFSGYAQHTSAVTDTKKDILFYNPRCDVSGASVTVGISKNIPTDWGEIFTAAANKFSLHPNWLAAIFLAENGGVWRPLTYSWSTSPTGAKGPMQLSAAIWTSHQQDGNNDGNKDINNPWDAVFASASYSKMIGVRKTSLVGDITKPFDNLQSLLVMAGLYNQGTDALTARGITTTSPLSAFAPEGQRFMKNTYSYLTTDFTKSDSTTGYADPNPTASVGPTIAKTTDSTPCLASGGGTTNIIEMALKVRDGATGLQVMSGLKRGIRGLDCGDCVAFVTTVYAAAGYPKPFNGTYDNQNSGIRNPEAGRGNGGTLPRSGYYYDPSNYELIPNAQKIPGDILAWDGHVAIYAGGNNAYEGGGGPGSNPTNRCNIGKTAWYNVGTAEVLRYKGPPIQ